MIISMMIINSDDNEAIQDVAANAGRGHRCWTRPPMLDEALQDEATRSSMLDGAMRPSNSDDNEYLMIMTPSRMWPRGHQC